MKVGGAPGARPGRGEAGRGLVGGRGWAAQARRRRRSVSAGEGIARSVGAGTFHNGEVLIQHPRTGNAEHEPGGQGAGCIH